MDYQYIIKNSYPSGEDDITYEILRMTTDLPEPEIDKTIPDAIGIFRPGDKIHLELYGFLPGK